MMSHPHDVALFMVTIGAAVGALLLSDAADEALRSIPESKRRPSTHRRFKVQVSPWARPVAFNCGSLANRIGAEDRALSGAMPLAVPEGEEQADLHGSHDRVCGGRELAA